MRALEGFAAGGIERLSATSLGLALLLMVGCGSGAATSAPGSSPTAAPTPLAPLRITTGAAVDTTGWWKTLNTAQGTLVISVPGDGGTSLIGKIVGTALTPLGTFESQITVDYGEGKGARAVVPTAIALNPSGGGVAVGGRVQYSTQAYGGPTTAQPVIWTSSDSVAWHAIATSGPAFAGQMLALRGVTKTSSGYVATGSLAAGGDTSKTAIIVITSADGVAWTRTATIESTWSLDAGSITTIGSKLVLTGTERVCDATSRSTYFSATDVGVQPRVWTSVDAGATWTAAGVDTSGIIPAAAAAPADPSKCPGSDDLMALNKYSARATVASTETTLFILTDSGLFASADLTTWSAVSLPGDAALTTASRIDVIRQNGITTLLADAGTATGNTIRGWRSTDDRTWTAMIPSAPFNGAVNRYFHVGTATWAEVYNRDTARYNSLPLTFAA